MYSRQGKLIASIMSAADEAGLLSDPPEPSEPDALLALLRVAMPRSPSPSTGVEPEDLVGIEPLEDIDPGDLSAPLASSVPAE